MAIAFVQSGSGAGTTSVVFTPTLTGGNLVVVSARSSGGTGLDITVADGVNTYSLARNQDQTTDTTTHTIKYAMNVAGGATTITVTGAVGGTVRAAFAEYSGVATTSALDQVNSAEGTDNSMETGDVTTTVADELLFSAVNTGGAVADLAAAASYTIRETVATSRFAIADRIVAATSTYNGDWSCGTNNSWSAVIATFKIASGAATPIAGSYLNYYRSMVSGVQ